MTEQGLYEVYLMLLWSFPFCHVNRIGVNPAGFPEWALCHEYGASLLIFGLWFWKTPTKIL